MPSTALVWFRRDLRIHDHPPLRAALDAFDRVVPVFVLDERLLDGRFESPGRAAFLQAEGSTNDHDLGLFQVGAAAGPSEAGRRTVGLYHLAWEVDTLAELARIRGALSDAGALVGASDHATTKALYAQDPDGIEFEVSWLLPADLITPEIEAAGATTGPLDLDAEIDRYGAQTRGGIGVSVPA